MFYLNDTLYTQAQLEEKFRYLGKLAQEENWKKKCLAVCIREPFDYLALLLFCRKRCISIAPLHPDTPRETAFERAHSMGCQLLIWQHYEQTFTLEPESPAPTESLIQCSSGTTGEPRAIARAWENIEREIHYYNRTVVGKMDFQSVIACPLTHAYGLISGFLCALERGSTPRALIGLNPKYAIEVMQGLARPLLYTSPAFIYELSKLLTPGQKLFALMSSGAAIPQHHFVSFQAHCEHFLQQYGCSETGCISLAWQARHANCVGRPLECFRVEAGSDADTPAEIIVHDAGSSIRTRDLGFFDPDGQLHFCSRMDDTIIVSGYNVFPAEVENALLRHPVIREAVVFKQYNAVEERETVAAVYTGESELSSGELRRWCSRFLAPHQWPKTFHYCEHIPRNSNGKISRRKIAEWYARPQEIQAVEAG